MTNAANEINANTPPLDPKNLYDKTSLSQKYKAIRRESIRLIEQLSAEDCCVQSMEDASPAKWHLAHTTWFFETFVLEKSETCFAPFNESYRVLFNSYYNSVGEQFLRPARGMLTRPPLQEIVEFRKNVDARILSTIPKMGLELVSLLELGLHHEQQHQELLLMDIKHLLSLNPLNPAYYNHDQHTNIEDIATSPAHTAEGPMRDYWLQRPGGLVEFGNESKSFHFDNETPLHNSFLHPHKFARRLVTNGEYLEFIEAGGYASPLHWLADGWTAVQEYKWCAPLYWRRQSNQWTEFSMHGLRDLDLSHPVSHVSYYEADAYARWKGARLPTEFEWESSASRTPKGGELPEQMFDTLWQWTSSSYQPYPGFRAPSGAVGEYNGKFMVNQMTLRGSSSITPPGHARPTYRNFYYPHQRWVYAGIRLAQDD